MKLATVLVGDKQEAAQILADGSAQLLGKSMLDLVGLSPSQLKDLCADTSLKTLSPNEVVLSAPIPRPTKNVFCVGRNYMEHIAEGDRAQKIKDGVTEVPVFFTKPPTAVTGPDGEIPIFPEVSTSIDYEVELALIIGKAGRGITKEEAYSHIFGYTVLNDISARDVQRRHGGQYFKGKALDGSCPMGPWIITADDVPNPQDLGIRCSVNGDMRQNGNTRDMIFDIPTLIASLSAGLTLEPGDIIATGTPSGVGYAMEPPHFLTDGDTVICEVDGIGTLSNVVRNAHKEARIVA